MPLTTLMNTTAARLAATLLLALLAACEATPGPQAVQVTIPPTQIGAGAPIYTATATLTPTLTPTVTPSETPTLTPTITPSPTLTLTPTPSNTPTPRPSATPPLWTPTAPSAAGAPAPLRPADPGLSAAEGWSCGDFPCEWDIAGFLQRIRVPEGFALEHAGRFPGQPLQIAYGSDGRLYATLLENGTRIGAVYVMEADGTVLRYSGQMVSPLGLAFQPGTDVLYVTARLTPQSGGVLWRVLSDGRMEVVLDDLPCCFNIIDNQPAGLTFGPDGLLYMGVAALTDHAEPPDPMVQEYADIHPREAAVLRVNPHTGEVSTYAQGIRSPYGLAFDSTGQLYATDNGLVTGPGDRLLAVQEGLHYGWPFWRARGCGSPCPARRGTVEIADDLYTFPDYTLPRGLVAYHGTQFPANFFDTLFVALWNGTDYAQRIVWIDPRDSRLNFESYAPQPFVTGLIRPSGVAVAPDGSLVIADFIYGHVWRVRYEGGPAALRTAEPAAETQPTVTEAASTAAGPVFATSTPRP